MASAIKNAHIFSVGTWNKTTVTAKTLDGIVAAFNELAQAGRVPLKFGHNDEQPLTDGQPALGWVSRVWHDGRRLFADFADVPSTVFQAIKNKLYKFVSVELLTNAEREGKKYPYVLDAVALLGADPPAVRDLAELEALATMARIAYTATGARESFKQAFRPTTGGDDDMDPKELQAAIQAALGPALAPLNEQVAALTTANKDLKIKFDATEAERTRLQKLVDEQAATAKTGKVKMARDNAKLVLEAAVRDKRILPAQREIYAKLFKLDDDEAVLALDLTQLEEMVSTKFEEAKKIMGSKQAYSRAPGAKDDTEGASDPNDEIAELTIKYSRERNVDVFAALPLVLQEHPRLAAQFTQVNFEPWEASRQ